MKRLLLVSFAFIICIAFEMEVSANPAINVREKPAAPKTQGFVASESTDTYFYLYNVDAQAFFTEGNAWGTQVSLGATGLRVAFVPEGTAYLFNDYSLAKNAWKFAFFDTENRMYVDLGSQANYRWGVEDNGATFRLFAADEEAGNPGFGDDKPAYREGMYVGWVKGSNSTACVPYLPVADENCINWAFVTEEDYLPYEEAILVYNAAETLKAILEEAEGLEANIVAQLEVYNNLSSTIEELNSAGEDIKPIIEVRKNLKKALDEAKAAGFTEIVDADAVYFNGDATKSQLEKALTDLNAAVVEWGKTHASVANPANMTSKIVNPNFDNASYAGWTSDGDNPNMTGSGSHGPANVAEHWNHVFNTYQDIADLPAGVYALGAQVGWRSSWQEMLDGVGPAASLYATVGDVEFSTPFANMWACRNTEPLNGQTYFGTCAGESSYTDYETGVKYYSPNDLSAFRLYAEKGYYDRKLLFGVSEGTVRIGVKMPTKLGGGDNWSCFDTFTLTYYGSGADAAQLYVDESLKNFSEITIPEGTVYTESYLTAYQEALAGDKTANSYDEAVVIINAIRDSKKAIDNNIQLWKDWQDLVNKVRSKYVLTDEYAGIEPEIDDIADYVDESMNVSNILDAHNLTNEQLQAEMAQLNAWAESLVEKSKLDVWDGKNMTQCIKNADFEDGIEKGSNPSGLYGDYGTAVGWNADKKANGNFTSGPFGWDTQMEAALGKANHYYEAWHCHNFDLWQEVEGLPVGMYELEVQGYVRCEVFGYTRGNDIEPDYPSPVVLYMNDATSKLKNIYSESLEDLGYSLTKIEDWTIETINEKQYPNSIGGATQCFGWGMYKTSVYGLIAKEGDILRIGVKMDKDQDWWCVWDNFKLTYKKPTVDIMKPEMEKALQEIYTTQPMGKLQVTQAQSAKQKAEAAIASNDDQEMFDALAEIYAVMGSIRASVDLFKGLQEAVQSLDDAAYLSENATAKAEVVALAAEIKNGIASHSYEDAEVEGLLEQIAKATTKLYMPEDMASASDANPVECTKVIKTPAFENEEDYTNSSEGWTGAGNLGNDDTQKSVLAMEFWQSAFDMYQTIVGLPKGTYKLTVDAWCRAGSNEENYAGWQANHRYTMASLYAIDGNSTVYSAPIANMMKGMMTENPGLDGVDEIMLGGKNYWVPNSMVGGRCYIDVVEEGTYTNSVICKVGDDGKLTVGIKKLERKDNSWVVLDNFRLYYFGPNSTKQVSDGSTPDDDDTQQATPEVTLDFTLADANDSRVSLWGFPASSANKTVEEKSFTYGGYTVKVAGSEGQGYYWHNKDHYLLFGKQGATVTLPAFDFDVERIEIEGNSGASAGVKQNIYVGENAVSAEVTGAQGTNIFDIAADYQAAGNVYVIKVNSNHNNMIKTIKIWKKGTSGEIITPEEPETESNEAKLLSFGFFQADNPGLSKDYVATIPPLMAGKTTYDIEVAMPKGTDLTSLVAQFTVNVGNTVKIDGEAQTSGVSKNDFTDPIDYTVSNSNKTSNLRYTITIVDETAEANTWKELAILDPTAITGDETVTGVYAGSDLKINPKDNMPYMAFGVRGADNKLSVAKFDGSAWSRIGAASFTNIVNGSHYGFDIAPDGTPYVAYGDQEATNKGGLSVMKFNGSAWSLVGDAGITATTAQFVGIAAVENGVIAAQQNNSKSGDFTRRAVVASYWNGSTWASEAPFTSTYARQFIVSNGKEAYILVVNASKPQDYSIIKTNGVEKSTIIENCLPEGATSGMNTAKISLALAPDGTLYLLAPDDATGAAKMRLSVVKNGALQTVGGDVIPVSEGAYDRHSIVKAAIAPDGTPFVAYNDNSDDNRVFYIYLDKESNQWSKPIIVASGAGSWPDVNIAFTATGIGYLTYTDKYDQIHLFMLERGGGQSPEEPEEPIATTEEVLKVEDVTVNKEQTVSVDICLDNKKTNLTAYQFDLTLPAGITLAKNNKGKFLVTKTSRYEDEAQSLSASLLDDNTYRIVSFSLSNGIIEGTSGAILNAVLAIDRNVLDRTYKAQITNIIFTQADGKQLKLADAKFDIVVNNMVEGDANGDGEVNVSDIVEVVNYIMGKPSAGFVFAAADLNGDGEVNVTDIVIAVNIIMAGNGNNARSMEGKADLLADNDYLKLDCKEDGRMSLNLENQGSYVASQFDLRLSDGQELKGITLNGNRIVGHHVNYTQMGEGLYRVIVYSLSNEAYKGQAGELLNFDIAGAGTVSVENILFVTARQTERRFASLQSVTTGIMAVKALPSDNGQWFDLQGRRVDNSAKKGVYINRGKKLVVR